jgi:hypothetical protein
MLANLEEGSWICPGCGDLQKMVKACRMCGTAQPKTIKVEVMSQVAKTMVTNKALCYNWQNPWQAKEIGGFTASGKQLQPGETQMCNVHWKRRSARNLIEEPEGSGMYRCGPGFECVVKDWSAEKPEGSGKGKKKGAGWGSQMDDDGPY